MNIIDKVSLYKEVAVIIPARDEAKTLPSICKELRDREAFFVVIDDGSVDGGSQLVRYLDGQVCRHEKSLGKGAALQTGFNWVLKNSNAKWVAVIDGDGQHQISDLDNLIKVAKDKKSDFVLGEREFRDPMPIIRRITNRVMSYLLKIITKYQINDSQCGLRIFSRGFLENTKFKSKGFEIESEMLIVAAKHKIKINIVPIKTIYLNIRESYIQPSYDTVRWLRFILKETLS